MNIKLSQKKLNEIMEDCEKLGPGVKMNPSRKMSKEETDRIYEKAGLQMVSIRLPNEVIEKLKDLAEKDGLKYQPYVRRLLIQYVGSDNQSSRMRPLTEDRVRQIFKEEFGRKR